MVAAGRLAKILNLWPEEAEQRQNTVIQKTKLPTEIPSNADVETMIALLKSDKKVQDGQVRFILPRAIADVFITNEVTDDNVRPVLTAMMAQ